MSEITYLVFTFTSSVELLFPPSSIDNKKIEECTFVPQLGASSFQRKAQKCLEPTLLLVVVIWHDMTKTELNWIETQCCSNSSISVNVHDHSKEHCLLLVIAMFRWFLCYQKKSFRSANMNSWVPCATSLFKGLL